MADASTRPDLDAIRSRAACAYGTHDCDFDGCDGGGPWPIPWAVVDDIKGDGHWDNEFHVLTENGEGSGLATFEYRPHAELFANAVADIAALLAEVERLQAERDAMLREAVRSRNDVERLKASYGWLDERFLKIKAEVERLRAGIRRHRNQIPHDSDMECPADRRLWALLDDRTENHDG